MCVCVYRWERCNKCTSYYVYKCVCDAMKLVTSMFTTMAPPPIGQSGKCGELGKQRHYHGFFFCFTFSSGRYNSVVTCCLFAK